jgi:hypothetical protein
MRDEYLIHKTHRTFRAWLLPFALLAGNLNATRRSTERQLAGLYIQIRTLLYMIHTAVHNYFNQDLRFSPS